MSAPAKLSGGRATKTTKPGTGPMSATKPAPDRSPRERSVGGYGKRGGGGLPKPPQGNSGFKDPRGPYRPPRREGTAPRYSNQNSKQQMLSAAIQVASERGYEAMRISEITDPIGVTRQAFYAHFRDKRHCLAEAIDPKLGAIERMAASLSESDPDAATRMAHALDDLIAERFGSPEGTRGRLVGAMIELLRKDGTFHKIRIGALTKTAHVPPGDFYRQFSGKQECFAVAYEQLLGELLSEVSGGDLPDLLDSLAEALIADDDRRRILITEMAHLPDRAPPDIQGARKSAMRVAIAKLLSECDGTIADEASIAFAAGSIVEVIRSAVLGDRIESLPSELAHAAAVSSQGHAELAAAA